MTTLVNTPPAADQVPDGLSFAERAYRDIRDRIVMLDIAPGEPLNDDELARALHVGRTPVREALKRLEYEHLVVAYPRRGTFATEVNITDLAHISEVRQLLEPDSAANAARRANDADKRVLTDLLGQLGGKQLGDGSADRSLMRLDMAVHRAIYRACHNPYLEDTLIRFDNLATRIWCLFLDRLPDMAGHIAEHGELIEAVLAGDAAGASKLTLHHIRHFDRAIRAAI